jgi:hypothetical protein
VGEGAEYTIGTKVACADGACGELSRVVIDPLARVLTHLVVEPTRGSGFGRLVPIELVADASPEIRLGCTSAEFDGLPDAEETHFLTATDRQLDYADDEVFSWPYYGLAAGMGGMGMAGMGVAGNPPFATYDRVPVGEVDLRRGEHVQAQDGSIGSVQGLVIDDEHHVTHVLLQEGHLWGKKDVAIPIGAVTGVDAEGVHLNITRDQVHELPAVTLH